MFPFALEGDPMGVISTAVSNGLQTVQANAMNMIGQTLPYGLAIMGAILAVGIALKAFKKVTGK